MHQVKRIARLAAIMKLHTLPVFAVGVVADALVAIAVAVAVALLAHSNLTHIAHGSAHAHAHTFRTRGRAGFIYCTRMPAAGSVCQSSASALCAGQANDRGGVRVRERLRTSCTRGNSV